MRVQIIIPLLLLSGLTATCQVSSSPKGVNSDNFTTAASASGSSKPFASEGCVELGGDGSFTSTSISSPNGSISAHLATIIVIAPYFGFFPVKGLELGVNPLSFSSITEASSSPTTSLIFMFAPSYNFSTHSNVYPFIEAGIGHNSVVSGSVTESGLCYEGRAGIKVALAPHALFNFSLQYLVENYNSNGIAFGSLNNLVVGFGFTVSL